MTNSSVAMHNTPPPDLKALPILPHECRCTATACLIKSCRRLQSSTVRHYHVPLPVRLD
jgi:hypothetical protein